MFICVFVSVCFVCQSFHQVKKGVKLGVQQAEHIQNIQQAFVQSPTCPCGEEDQKVDHVLQRCKRHNQEVAKLPTKTSPHRKLYENTDDLKKTTTSYFANTLVILVVRTPASYP